jgi:Xaa-Pro aminopeptidase
VYPHQTERLTDVVERHGLEALVASSLENVFYVTGFRSVTAGTSRARPLAVFSRRGTALVVPAADVPAVIADRVAVDHVACFGQLAARLEHGGPDRERVRDILDGRAATPADALAAALDALGIKAGQLGLDDSALTHQAWEATTARLAPGTVVPAGQLFGDARRVKSPYEIECLERALHIAEEALNAVLQTLAAGVTEREAVDLYEAEVRKRHAAPGLAIVAMGDRSSLPAPAPTERALRPGDLVRFDVAAVFKGYHGSVARTALLGDPDTRQQALHDAIQAGVEAAIRQIRPGVTAGEVYEGTVQAVRDGGLPDYQPEQVGHGTGLEPYEAPSLAPRDTTALELAEVLTIHLPYLDLGVAGVAVRDTTLVARLGARPMNRSVHALVSLD